MKYRNFTERVKFSLLTLFLFAAILPAMAITERVTDDDDGKHDMKNMNVTIEASLYKSSRFIEKETIKGKEYIYGKSSSYNKKGEANAGRILQPNAEYAIRTKLPGGTYNITVFYQIDKEKAPETPKVAIGINTQEAQEIEIKNKLVNSVKASFNVNFLKGKKHTVKVWFPSEGVKIREIKVARALIPKKNK